MFSQTAFAESPFSTLGWTAEPAPVSDPTLFTEAVAERCWLLRFNVFSLAAESSKPASFSASAFSVSPFAAGTTVVSGAIQSRYFSSRPFVDEGIVYAPRFIEARLERRFAGRSGIGGMTRHACTVRLSNADGELDSLLLDYSILGRSCWVSVGRPDDDAASFVPVFFGVASEIDEDASIITLTLEDSFGQLSQPVQKTFYSNVSEDIDGKPKPLCYGKVFNIEPLCIDFPNLTYQVHDGQVYDIPVVRDRGIALTKVGGTPTTGQYSVNLSAGTFKLGATPSGIVTCDVEGHAPGGVLLDTASEIVQALLLRDGFDNQWVDTSAFSRLAGSNPYVVGVYVGPNDGLPSTGAVIDSLLSATGAWGGVRADAKFTVGVAAHFSSSGAREFSEGEIISLQRVPIPAGIDPLVWKVDVLWQVNYTPMTDWAAAVTSDFKEWAAQPARVASASDSSILSRHRLARVLRSESFYAVKTEAEAEALRLWNFWSKPDRRAYRVGLPFRGLLVEVGDMVRLRYPRYGLQDGVQALVVETAKSSSGGMAEIMVIV